MGWEVHSGLSGSGFVELASSPNSTYQRSAVTSLGVAESLDPSAPSRYLHLGLWSFYEDIADDVDGMPDGLYLAQYHFLNFLRETWADDSTVRAHGYTGFFYRLFPGVVATLEFFQE
jgi:hypothetical protein